MSKMTNTTLTVLTTAAAGAAMMYLFDPQHGGTRRGRITGYASDRFSDLAGKVSDLTANVTGSPTLNAFADRASDAADGSTGALRQQVGRLSGYVSQLASGLSARARRSDDDDDDRGHHMGTAAAVSVGGIGMLVLGAGLMYFLDPVHGERRRSTAYDKINSSASNLGGVASRSGTYIRDHASTAYHAAGDMAHNIGGRFSHAASAAGDKLNPRDLIQKAKDTLNGISESFRTVRLHMQNGKLVIDGTVPAAAYDRAASALAKIPGMPEVVNNLHVTEGTEH